MTTLKDFEEGGRLAAALRAIRAELESVRGQPSATLLSFDPNLFVPPAVMLVMLEAGKEAVHKRLVALGLHAEKDEPRHD